MKKIIILFFLLFSFIIYIKGADINEKDIKQFLSFADKYLDTVKKFLNNDEKNLKLDAILYLENQQIIEISESFLKKNGWTIEKMYYFISITSLVITYIEIWEKYNAPEGEQIVEEISKDSILLIKKYKDKLLKYITILEYDENLDSEETNVTDQIDNNNYKNFIGNYKMNIENNIRANFFDSDEIIIKKINNNEIKGEVVISWDIGPQARIPMEWEKTYYLSFSSNIINNNIKFSVIVAEKYQAASKYEFNLYLEKENSTPVIKGKLKIISIKDNYTSNHNVKAIKY